MAFDGNYSDTAAARAERRTRPEREGRATPISSTAVPPPAAKTPDRPKKATAGEDREASRRRRRISALEEKIAAREKDIETIETRLWEEGLELGPVESHRLSRGEGAAPRGAGASGRGVGEALGGRDARRLDDVAMNARARAAIVAVGSEMLGPFRRDTNSIWLTGKLEEAGIAVVRKAVVPDDAAEIARELTCAAETARLDLHDGRPRPDGGRPDRLRGRRVDGSARAPRRGVRGGDARALGGAARRPHARGQREAGGRPARRPRSGEPARNRARFLARKERNADRHPAGSSLGDARDLRAAGRGLSRQRRRRGGDPAPRAEDRGHGGVGRGGGRRAALPEVERRPRDDPRLAGRGRAAPLRPRRRRGRRRPAGRHGGGLPGGARRAASTAPTGTRWPPAWDGSWSRNAPRSPSRSRAPAGWCPPC